MIEPDNYCDPLGNLIGFICIAKEQRILARVVVVLVILLLIGIPEQNLIWRTRKIQRRKS